MLAEPCHVKNLQEPISIGSLFHAQLCHMGKRQCETGEYLLSRVAKWWSNEMLARNLIRAQILREPLHCPVVGLDPEFQSNVL